LESSDTNTSLLVFWIDILRRGQSPICTTAKLNP